MCPPPLFPSPCPPCPLWFAFSVSSVVCFSCGLPPPVTTLPKTFSIPFQPLANSPFPLLLLLSCMLKVKGAADALVGARTADGESPGQQRRRLQPQPSPDGGELRSLKPAAGGEQAGEASQLKQNKEAIETSNQLSKEPKGRKNSPVEPTNQQEQPCRDGPMRPPWTSVPASVA